MIIYNRKEIPSKYTLSDNAVFEITSRLSLGEIYDALRKGEIPPEEVKVYMYVNGDGKVSLESENMPETSEIEVVKSNGEKAKYLLGKDSVFSESVVDLLETSKNENALEREKLFDAFEKFMFGKEVEGYSLRRVEFDMQNPQHREVLRRHIALSSGIMPTIYSVKGEDGLFSIPFEEAVKFSKDGDKLYRDFGKASVGVDNPLPTLEDIKYYRTLNEYEKRLAGNLTVHPQKILDMKKALEAQYGKGAVVSEDYYNALFKKGKSVEEAVSKRMSVPQDRLEALKDVFQKEYHFVPRIISEYLAGALIANDKKSNEELSKSFSRPSVSAPVFSYTDEDSGKEVKITVAQTGNPALIYLSSKINFAEIPQQLLRAMSVYINESNIGALEKKGLSKWINANKNTNIAEFVKMIEAESNIDEFIPNMSAGDLANYKEIKLAIGDMGSYEKKYNYKFSDNEIAIRGRHLKVTQGNVTIRTLEPHDLKNFTTGYKTKCCQHFGNAGESCVWKLTTDPFAANVVIEKNGDVVGQAFVWADEAQDIFVFDNIEWANDGDIKPYLNIIGVYVKNLPYSNVQLGMGYTQGMNGVGRDCKLAANMPTTLSDRHIYSDYHPTGSYSRARDLKRINGRTHREEMVSFPINESMCQVTCEPDEPTKWDELASPQFNFMLNDCHKSVEERLQIARDFRENPTVELQKKVFASCPSAILSIENPDPALQLEMYEKHPEVAKNIPHPCPELTAKILADDPEMLRHMDGISEEIVVSVLTANGLLIDCIENPTDAEIIAAVTQNGYAATKIRDFDTRLSEEMKLTAVSSQPRMVTLFDHPSEACQMEAASKDPEAIAIMMSGENLPCERAQMSAIRRKPELILRDCFKDASEAVIRCAVQSDPKVIQRFQFKYPELRMEAIGMDGFVIRGLSNVTAEEYSAACRQNPAVGRLVAPPTGIASLPETREDDSLEIG